LTVERKSPIPAGRYYVDAEGDEAITQFDLWRRMYSSNILVEDVESDLQANTPSAFYIFTLYKPTERWSQDAKGLGLPNVAPPDVKSKSDVYQVPTVETPDLLDAIGKVLGVDRGIVIFGLITLCAFTWATKQDRKRGTT
jgi:hypothetical protein